MVIGYIIGQQDNPALEKVINTKLGYTTAAVIWQESFVGDKVIRFHPNDPSYGVMAVTFTAYLETLKIRDTSYSTIQNHYTILQNLLTHDIDAITIGYTYLSNKIILKKDLWKGVAGYNGGGLAARNYMLAVKDKVSTLKRCKTL